MSLRVVKGLVVVMSAALLIGFVILLVGLAQQATRMTESDAAPPFRTALDLQDGSEILSIAGAGDRVAVLVQLGDGDREIHFIDPETGRVIGIAAAD